MKEVKQVKEVKQFKGEDCATRNFVDGKSLLKRKASIQLCRLAAAPTISDHTDRLPTSRCTRLPILRTFSYGLCISIHLNPANEVLAVGPGYNFRGLRQIGRLD